MRCTFILLNVRNSVPCFWSLVGSNRVCCAVGFILRRHYSLRRATHGFTRLRIKMKIFESIELFLSEPFLRKTWCGPASPRLCLQRPPGKLSLRSWLRRMTQGFTRLRIKMKVFESIELFLSEPFLRKTWCGPASPRLCLQRPPGKLSLRSWLRRMTQGFILPSNAT